MPSSFIISFFVFPKAPMDLTIFLLRELSSVLNMILWSCGVFISQASCSSCNGSVSLFILFPTIYSYTTGLISFSDLRYTQLFYPFDRSQVCAVKQESARFLKLNSVVGEHRPKQLFMYGFI